MASLSLEYFSLMSQQSTTNIILPQRNQSISSLFLDDSAPDPVFLIGYRSVRVER
jgi:hypothetical protein